MLHLHTYIHETSRATTHRSQPSAVSHSPKPATRAHARRHVGRPSPVGCSRHGGVCVLVCGTVGLNLSFSSLPPAPGNTPFGDLV